MLKKTLIVAGSAVVLLGGAYWAYDYYAGNHVEVKQVIPASASAENNGNAVEAGESPAAAAAALDPQKLNGTWSIQPESAVYFSVTTSKETVNFEIPAVEGAWKLDTADVGQMTAEGTVDLTKLSSGNGQRDGHIMSGDFLQVDQFPQAKFTVKSFGELPKEWKEGEVYPMTLNGTLELRGMSKDITFDSEVMVEQDLLKLQGKSMVTFDDFGMKNPHTVVLDTENNVALQLSLIMKQ